MTDNRIFDSSFSWVFSVSPG